MKAILMNTIRWELLIGMGSLLWLTAGCTNRCDEAQKKYFHYGYIAAITNDTSPRTMQQLETLGRKYDEACRK